MKILITYASTTGNTEIIAKTIAKYLQTNLSKKNISLIDMDELNPNNLNSYDLVFIGSSTWGEGEFNDISEEFFEKFSKENLDLKQIKFAIFGLGDKFYTNFCTVVDLMKKNLVQKNAHVLEKTLKIDGFPDDKIIELVKKWTNYTIKSLDL